MFLEYNAVNDVLYARKSGRVTLTQETVSKLGYLTNNTYHLKVDERADEPKSSWIKKRRMKNNNHSS